MSQPLLSQRVTTGPSFTRPLEGRAKMEGEVEGTIGEFHNQVPFELKLQIKLKDGDAWIIDTKLSEANELKLTEKEWKGKRVAVTFKKEDKTYRKIVTEFRTLLATEQV